jgi:hypothetical protein
MKGADTSMTTTSQHATIIAVFADRDQANQAIDNLRHAGLSYDQIRLVDHGTNSFIEDLKGLFTGHTTAATNSADDWMRIGVPEQDARYYQSELDTGRSIVLSKAVDNPEQTLSILRQSGAYDIAFRLRTAQPTIAPGTYDPNAQPGTTNPNVAPGTYDPNAQPGTTNPNVAPGTYDPNAQPGTYDTQTQPFPANTRGEQKA